ncbi:hypothetical protein BCR33DRAFT_791289 [Rhizoclosmatium globosum]|uniref:Uncharacterized protein n=1 Tax=Rhizoclosmatium globosum TaxID=329046 RepID=A0A1Y2BIE8_9FUNG|nr:hypothetical protein BCR33DRAFT_791289 [Rhizoclosmatium globosum]|eukprot:ORY33875.1 hypothetical protein BCR33DRAFT_791289 [Rhizoclosmatium globosum]
MPYFMIYGSTPFQVRGPSIVDELIIGIIASQDMERCWNPNCTKHNAKTRYSVTVRVASMRDIVRSDAKRLRTFKNIPKTLGNGEEYYPFEYMKDAILQTTPRKESNIRPTNSGSGSNQVGIGYSELTYKPRCGFCSGMFGHAVQKCHDYCGSYFCDATRANCKARAYKEHIQKCGNPMAKFLQQLDLSFKNSNEAHLIKTDEMLEWANPDFFKAFRIQPTRPQLRAKNQPQWYHTVSMDLNPLDRKPKLRRTLPLRPSRPPGPSTRPRVSDPLDELFPNGNYPPVDDDRCNNCQTRILYREYNCTCMDQFEESDFSEVEHWDNEERD